MICIEIQDETTFPLADGAPSRMARLRELVAAGAVSRWMKPLPAEVTERLGNERSFIERLFSNPRLDFASYFLIVRDCVEAVRRTGAFAGPWRGAASGSAVAYALGITDVDPVRNGLFFERFVGQNRTALPPVWIDFDIEGCETASRYIAANYHECGLETPNRIIFEPCALRTLSVLRECLKRIKERTGDSIDIGCIPEDDKKTLSVFIKCDTSDIFQFKSNDVMKWLHDVRPSCYTDVMAIGTLFYNPKLAMQFPAIARRKNGEEAVGYDHPLMESVLSETYGMVVYQEQIMALAKKLADFSRDESDALRYAMGRKMFDDSMRLKIKFISGCIANPAFRIGEWRNETAAKSLCEKIWSDWWSVASYAFNKSHAVAYTRLAWQQAYLKAHYPREHADAVSFWYNVDVDNNRG
ncbi:MAG: hypothetical protein K6G91_05210 [Kiritimatiellae bacterium]|nr:hypothetical protein [Kiritimatiellia bacterium]